MQVMQTPRQQCKGHYRILANRPVIDVQHIVQRPCTLVKTCQLPQSMRRPTARSKLGRVAAKVVVIGTALGPPIISFTPEAA